MYVYPVMGFNVLQIKCADCAAFSPHSGFVSLSLYVLFSHDKTSTNRMDPVNYGFGGLEKSDS